MEKIFSDRRTDKDVAENIELGLLNFNEIGINVTDHRKEKSSWVCFSLQKAKEIYSQLGEYIEIVEEKMNYSP
jgi:hypothetical protein